MNSAASDLHQTSSLTLAGAPADLPWLLVFDLDGTLIDSSLDLTNAVNAALTHIGHAPLPAEIISSFVGDGAATLVRRALRYSAVSETADEGPTFSAAFACFLEFYREHKLDNTRTYPGVLEALHVIRERRPELLMAVLTNKPVRPSREICAQLGLSVFFFANHGGDSFPTKKPAPDGLEHILAEARELRLAAGADPASLSASRVVMIGDSAVDVATARACGTRAVGCLYGLDPKSLALAAPDILVTSPAEWPSVLAV